MKLEKLRCPYCDGELEVEDGLDIFYCKYCGNKIILNGQSEAAYYAKAKVKKFEHNERMADKKYAHEKYLIEHTAKKEKSEAKTGIVMTIVLLVVFSIVCGVFFTSLEKKSKQQEYELQVLVDEIQVDIENNEFDEAYLKAQSIKYTEGWSSEIEEKWDNIRKAVINQVIEEEKEATGSSSHKPEKDGWFD